MVLRPLFWFFLFCQFLVFVFLVNRISCHPRKVMPEALWVFGSVLALFAVQGALVGGLAQAWDFRMETFQAVPFPWKAFAAGSILWVFLMALNHLEWNWLRRQPVDARMTLQRFP